MASYLLWLYAPRVAWFRFPFSWLFIMPCEFLWLRTLAFTRQYISDIKPTLLRFSLKQLGELFFAYFFFSLLSFALAGGVLNSRPTPNTSWGICSHPSEFLHVEPQPQNSTMNGCFTCTSYITPVPLALNHVQKVKPRTAFCRLNKQHFT